MKKMLQVKACIKGSSPPIWRRILVPASLTLLRTHAVLCEAMGWSADCPYQYHQDGRIFADPTLDFDYVEDDATYRLGYCLCLPGHTLDYWSGPWRFELTLEEIVEGARGPWKQMGGEGTCPQSLRTVSAVDGIRH